MKNAPVWLKLLVLVTAAAPCRLALAHLPVFDDGTAGNSEQALVISDIGLSQVVYHEVTAPAQPLWIAFDATAGQELYFNPGVPAIDRLQDYRPTFALVGPGLPEADLPFPLPTGYGAIVYPTADITAPEFFHEPFSGTDSWILFEETVTLLQTGRYYLVGYVPSGEPGKFWVAVGKREAFGLEDIATLPEDIRRVRAFHESSATALPCFLIPLGLLVPVLAARFMPRRRASGVS